MADGFSYTHTLSAPPNPDAKIGTAALEAYRSAPDTAKVAFRASLVKAGFTPEALAALDREGAPTPAAANPAIDAPESAEDYRLVHHREVLENLDAKQLAEVNAEVRAAFHSARVPVALGQTLYNSIVESAARYAIRSPEDQRMFAEQQGEILKRTFGEDRAKEMAADAEWMTQKLGEKLFKRFKFGGHSAESLVALANAAALIRYKESSKK